MCVGAGRTANRSVASSAMLLTVLAVAGTLFGSPNAPAAATGTLGTRRAGDSCRLLPTALFNGVMCDQVIIGNRVSRHRHLTQARPAVSPPARTRRVRKERPRLRHHHRQPDHERGPSLTSRASPSPPRRMAGGLRRRRLHQLTSGPGQPNQNRSVVALDAIPGRTPGSARSPTTASAWRSTATRSTSAGSSLPSVASPTRETAK